MEEIVRRLERLERGNRWWRTVGCVAVALFGVTILLGATRARVPDETRARRFVLVDATGRPRAVLG